MKNYSTATRMQMHRPNLNAEIGVPKELLEVLNKGIIIIREAGEVVSSLVPKAATIVCREVENLLEATTPEHRVRSISQITGILRETEFFSKRDKIECKVFLLKLASHFIFPLMLNSTVRYLHRALATLLRTVYVMNEELETRFREAFINSHINCWISNDKKRPNIIGNNLLNDVSSILQMKDSVMYWVNCIDSTAVVAIPIFPKVFSDTFLDIIPLLGDSLKWVVTNACMGSSQAKAGNATSGTLLGEDLSYVRYAIRVVTTYAHKFLFLLKESLYSKDLEKISIIQEDIVRLLLPALSMLSSSVFPKDVLNGAGLLVSSLLTLKKCIPTLLLEVCKLCGISYNNNNNNNNINNTISNIVLEDNVKELVKIIYSNDPEEEFKKENKGKESLKNILSYFTDNGRFALLKGLLAHLSTPLYGEIDSLGILLKPIIPLSNEINSSEPIIIIHDIIIPAAEAFCSALHSPDTRFMAIQTIDSIIRHISSIFTCISEILELNNDEDNKKNIKIMKWGLKIKDNKEFLLDSQRLNFIILCKNTPKLINTLNKATEIIMGMWDDSTQQVAGPLYDTYNEILAVHNSLKRCINLLSINDILIDNTIMNNFDPAQTLQCVLSIPNERRGKYHALLGLLNFLPISQFLLELTKHYSQQSVNNLTNIESLCCFSKMLIAGSNNNKIANISGDVFAKTSNFIRQLKISNENNEELFMNGIIEPLVKSLIFPGYVSTLLINETSNISNIVTHMIMPCLKNDEIYLSTLITQLIQNNNNNNNNNSRVNQSIVEIIHRARLVGRDISSYIQPNTNSFTAILASLQAQESELRYTALGLCVLSNKKAECVELWQCYMMEWYLSTNMHCGGDSATMRHLLEIHKKWMRRLVDSYMSQKGNKDKKIINMKGNDSQTEYKQLVIDHCIRMIACIVPHIGENAIWCRNLSLERRVAAMSIYSFIIRCVIEFFTSIQIKEYKKQLFPPTLVEGLLESLVEGWEKARTCAHSILIFYCEYAPEEVFNLKYLGKNTEVENIKLEILRSKTYRKSEGDVLRYILAKYFTPDAKQEASKNPICECEKRVEFLEKEIISLRENISKLKNLEIKEAYKFIQQYPLHGRISLCAALLSNAWEVKNDTNFLYDACNMLLISCSETLQACSILVGGETNNTNSLKDNDVDVDCRGHVFDKDGPNSEETMRTVVNNTWLSIRTGSTAIEGVIRLVKVEKLSFNVVRDVCYILMESLLRTKHNGVMRTVRQALKTVAAALLRSRDVIFHKLSGEMLDFLLGSDGVTSNNVARMLRRSQGLPHAMLAILEAEDASVPPYLFPKAMKSLISVATCTQESNNNNNNNSEINRSQRSNALNVLKFIFEHKSFASRSIAYLEDAFWIAAAGFEDFSWGIRNSSLMLFASVLPRFVGEHPSTGGVGVNTSLHDITLRAPRGVAFTYEELIKSCTKSTPSLGVFPLLQMLSMLTPDPPHVLTQATKCNNVLLSLTCEENEEKEKEEEEGFDLEVTDSYRIIRAVLKCGASRNLMIRAASSVALTSLVPPAHLESIMKEILQTTLEYNTNSNAIHGALLHLQQFHTFYIGTLRRHIRIRGMNSNATPTVASLVSKIIIEGLSSSFINMDSNDNNNTSKIYLACINCPTIAASFLNLASDALYYGYNCENNKNLIQLFNLVNFSIKIIYIISCLPTSLYNISHSDHAAVEEASALFTFLAVQFLTLKNNELINIKENNTNIWIDLCNIFKSKNSDKLISYLMNHITYYTTVKKWSHEVAENTIKQFKLKVYCDITKESLRMLLNELSDNSFLQKLSCTEVIHMKSHLEYLVKFVNNEELNSLNYKESFSLIEELLFKRMNPNTQQPLHNTEVQSWSIRFLARCACLRQSIINEEHLKLLSYYSHPSFNIQNRTAVVEAVKDELTFIPNMKKEYRCILLLILFKLLLDDAYEVRTNTGRVVSNLAAPQFYILDHTTCLLSLVCYLREFKKNNILSIEMIQKYLMGTETCEESMINEKDTDNSVVENGKTKELQTTEEEKEENNDNEEEEEEEEEDDDDILFEKEAENVFAEESLLSYLVEAIMQEKEGDGPRFKVYDDLINVAERKGNTSLLYTTLFEVNE